MGCSNNCTAWWFGEHQAFVADPEIAGIGMLFVFIASSGIALLLSLIHIILNPTISSEDNVIDFLAPRLLLLLWDIVKYIWDIIRKPTSAHPLVNRRKAHLTQLPRAVEWEELTSRVCEKVILNLSDQLLLTGTAVLIAGFWTHCPISVYHFALISDLAWFASNVHLITLVVLLEYLQDRPVLRNSRVFLMGCMAVFLTASTIMQGHRDWYISWPYDAQCVFNDLSFASIGGLPAVWMYVSLALIITGYPPSIVGLYKPARRFVNKWLHDKPAVASDGFIRYCESKRGENITQSNPEIITPSTPRTQVRCLLYSFLEACAKTCLKYYIFLYKILAALNDSRWFNLMFCLAWFGLGLAGVFGDRNIPRWDMDGTEKAMTFGQIVPILLLSSTLLVAGEAYFDVKLDMKNKDLPQQHSSRASLVHSRNTSTQAVGPGQSFEMSGALQSIDHHLDGAPSSIWSAETVTGHDSQASGIDDARPISKILQRPTWPVAGRGTDRTSSLQEERRPRRDH